MKAVLITQDDPFFLPNSLETLIGRMDGRHEIVGCILLDASPFGKQESFLRKAINTVRIFGVNFFLHYALRFLIAKLFLRNGSANVLKRHGIRIIKLDRPINSLESLNLIAAFEADVLISLSANQIFKKQLLDLTEKGCVNLHTSALPKYRGLMPTFWALKNGEQQIGVSVFLVDEGIDSGPILVQKMVNIDGKTQSDLIKLTKDIGMTCIVEALDKLEREKPVLLPNDDTQATYFSFPTREDVRDFRAAGARFF